jgi:MFS family permease
LVTLFGITTGMTVIWYAAQFYALFFMQTVLHVDYKTSYAIFAVGLCLGTPFIVLFGALSDRLGRRPIMIAGLVLGGLTLIPSFQALAHFANPELASFANRNPIEISAGTAKCSPSWASRPARAM